MNMGMASSTNIVFHKVMIRAWLDAINLRHQIPVTTLDFQIKVEDEEAQYTTKELWCHVLQVSVEQHCLCVVDFAFT